MIISKFFTPNASVDSLPGPWIECTHKKKRNPQCRVDVEFSSLQSISHRISPLYLSEISLISMNSTESAENSNNASANHKLIVMAGSTYDQSHHQIVNFNDPKPLLIDGPYMSIKLHVQMRDYTGLSPNSPRNSAYFDHRLHHKDYYSIGFSCTPKKSINSKDLVWGNDFDHPIRDHLPVGFNIAYNIAKTVIDPGIDCDAHSETPWSYGPALSC